MLKRMMQKSEELKSRGSEGFTLMELIIVIAILAMLIGMLLPKFANYSDKAMGTVAGTDTKNILTIVTAYNLDNDKQMELDQLRKETGIGVVDGAGGKSLVQPAGATGAGKSVFTYVYMRGGAIISARIDAGTGQIQYWVTGASGIDDTYESGDGTTAPPAPNNKQSGRIAKGLGF